MSHTPSNKRKAAKAVENIERFASIVEYSDAAIISKTLSGIITSWNPAAEKMFGYTAEEIIGQSILIIVPPERLDEELEILAGFARGELVRRFETIQMRKDGQRFDVSATISPIKDAEGKIVGASKIVRDITERKRTENELRESNEKTRQFEARLFQSQKMETVGRLAGGVAHEFNSILTAIIGQSDLMLRQLSPEDPLRKNANEINKAAERAATLTRHLLAYGRKQVFRPQILDLDSVLARMKISLGHLMGEGTDVHIVHSSGLKTVKADVGQIKQVITNLAMNAADAMPQGGKLTLETTNVTLDDEYVQRFPELKAGPYVMLAVMDTGAGMREDVRARAFEPFFTTKDVGQGTGLGLSTCYGIIKQSGGHITVYSEEGLGATFIIYLPQVTAQQMSPTPRIDSFELPRGTETILVVESKPALREMTSTFLGRLGYTVLAAANDVEALGMKQRREISHIDLLFTDIVMPHMAGKELAESVRALYPRTRVLFTSPYREDALIVQGVLKSGVALLQKPFTPTALANKLREVLDMKTG